MDNNGKEYKMRILEDETREYSEMQRKKKKRVIRTLIWSGVALVVLVVLAIVLGKLSDSLSRGGNMIYSYDPLSEDHGEGFYPIDLTHDIMKDENYIEKNRSVYFSSDGIGQTFTDDNMSGANAQAIMFCNYFKAAINGDGAKLNTFFTSDYFANNGDPISKYRDKLGMQKIYNIKVEQVGSSYSEKTIEGVLYVEYYKVSFLLLENNGQFRPDLPEPDGGTIPVIFEVLTVQDESLINRVFLPENRTTE